MASGDPLLMLVTELPLDDEITPDDPLLTLSHFTTLVQHAVCAMSMQQREANFEFYDKGLWWW